MVPDKSQIHRSKSFTHKGQGMAILLQNSLIPVLDASISMEKGQVKSGNAKTGIDNNACLRASNVVCYTNVQAKT
jgi:hypothetical protein